MKITIEFDGIEEFLRYVNLRGDVKTTFTNFDADVLKKAKEMQDEKKSAFEKAQEKTRKLAEATEEATAMSPPWQEPEPAAAEEEKPAPVYVLTDAQKAVREVVKKKGKDTAKEILARFPHKDKENEPATGASALRPEDYPAAIKALEEALNG